MYWNTVANKDELANPGEAGLARCDWHAKPHRKLTRTPVRQLF